MENEVKVREGTLKDFDECIRITFDAVKENALVEPDYKKLLEHIYAALTRDMGIGGVIGEEGGPLEAVMLLRIGTVWYSSEHVLEEKVLYVKPEFRSEPIGRARKLVEWAKDVSIKLELPLAIGVLSNERTKSKIHLYERFLGPQAGAYFLYNGKTGLGEGVES
jgi:GNAT superfamily N-acetyltransferase